VKFRPPWHRSTTTTPATVSPADSATLPGGPQWQQHGRAGREIRDGRTGAAIETARCPVGEGGRDGVVAQGDRRRSGDQPGVAGGLHDDQATDLGGVGRRSGGVGRNRHEDRIGVREVKRTFGDQPEHPCGFIAREHLGGDIAGRLDPGLADSGLFVEARVVDGDSGGRRQCLDQDLVVLGELRTAGLLRQIEVAVDLVADAHRNTEEGPHLRMPGREAHRVRVGADVGQPDRGRIVQEHTQHPPSGGQPADRGAFRVRHPDGDEVDDVVVTGGRIAADAEGPVAGVDQFGRRPHDGAQCHLEVEPGSDRQHRVDQAVEPELRIGRVTQGGALLFPLGLVGHDQPSRRRC